MKISNNIRNPKMAFQEIVNAHPIAAQIFVFLRHKCPSEFITDEGWVQLSIIRELLNLEPDINELIRQITYYNHKRRKHYHINLNLDQEWYVRVKTCHSITNIDENEILERWYPRPDQKGYVFLRLDKQEYKEGEALKPLGKRNCICIRLNDTPGKSHYAKLTIDLFQFAEENPIYTEDNRGVFVRNEINSKYIEFEYL
jgi:hypothetical protein